MPIIDFHCDTIDKLYANQTSLLTNDYHIDLNKLKTGGYSAQWFAIFIDKQSTDRPLMELARDMYYYFISQVNRHSEYIELAKSFEDYKRIKERGKMAAFLSLEEGAITGDNPEYIKEWSDLGARMMTLTWNYENELGYPHSSVQGLTQRGRQTVDYLNSTPILLDISHLSETAVKELETLYKKPLLASHCNARGVYRHTRNLSDDVIKKIAESGGIMGINLYSLFLNGSPRSTLEAICRQVAYIYQLGGEEILALGTDFDGIQCDLEVCDAGEMGKLIDRLAKIYSQSFIDKFTHQNAERIIKENL
ncbi:MAG: Membrane dipeptidase [Clostridia bacterium]|jgi:membrane dipeptidase|nr:Membrane dipeptidase [Clostridia bacterium]